MDIEVIDDTGINYQSHGQRRRGSFHVEIDGERVWTECDVWQSLAEAERRCDKLVELLHRVRNHA